MIYRYARTIVPGPNGTVTRHNAGDGELVELATMDGYTYVSQQGDIPQQPPGVTLEPVVVTDELRAALRTESPILRQIDASTATAVRERYTLDEELYFARISVGALMGTYVLCPGEQELLGGYQMFVETARAEAQAKREALGL